MRTRLIPLTPFLLFVTVLSAHCGEDTSPGVATTRAGARPLPDSGAPPANDAAAPAPPPPTPYLSCGALLEGSSCDPVTAWPCDTTAGETCDYSNTAGAFRCYPGPNEVPFCAACNSSDAFCGPGLLCNDRLGCDRFCCQDSDCKIGRCTLNVYRDPSVAAVGHCFDELLATCGPPQDGGVSANTDADAAASADASADSGL